MFKYANDSGTSFTKQMISVLRGMCMIKHKEFIESNKAKGSAINNEF